MLADEIDYYKGRNNKYVDDNIQEILIKPYEVSITIFSSSKTSFIIDEVKNILKYIKFV